MKKPITILSIFFLLVIISNSLFAEKVIGVTKFENLTKNQELEWLGSGIADAITFKYSKVKDIIIVDRTNVEKIMQEIELGQYGLVDKKSAKNVGKALGADMLVSGSFVKMGNNVRISAKLVEVESHKIINQVQIDGTIDDIFKLQDDVAINLIKGEGSEVRLSDAEEKRITSSHKAKNLSAYEFYSKGQDFYIKNQYYEGIEMFTKAIEIDSNYDLAYTGLSKSYSSLFWHVSAILEKPEDPSLLDKSYEYANKALKLNPDLDEAHISLSKYYQNVKIEKVSNKWEMCEREAKKALSINSNNAEGLYILSRVYATNQVKEEEYLKKALDKNRFLVGAQLSMGILYYNQNKYNLAESYMKKTIEIEPKYFLAYSWLGFLYNKKGELNKAVELYESVLKKYPDYTYIIRNLGIYYRDLKRTDDAMAQFRKAVRLKENDHMSWHEIGSIYMNKGEYDESIGYFKKALKIQPEYYYSLANMGYSLSMKGDYDGAFTFLEKAYNLHSDKDWPAGHIGWIYKNKRIDKSKARIWYERASKRNPNDSSYKKYLNELDGN